MSKLSEELKTSYNMDLEGLIKFWQQCMYKFNLLGVISDETLEKKGGTDYLAYLLGIEDGALLNTKLQEMDSYYKECLAEFDVMLKKLTLDEIIEKIKTNYMEEV